jgi:sugar phosphate permease
VPRNKQNIMAIRQKALQKIEKQIKKIDSGRASNLDSTGFGADKEPFMAKLKSVISNKVFMSLCMCLTGLFFVVTGIQYWAPDYLKNILNVDDHTASVYFATTSLFAPVSGVIIGGIITTSYGGYNQRKAQLLQCVVGVCACLVALPIPFMSDFFYVGILFWVLLFCGGFILPPVTGIMINSVGDYQKSSANSVANLIYNLLGFAPAPGLYGFVSQTTGSDRWSMGMLLYSTIFTIGALLFGVHHKLKREEAMYG